ILERAGFVAAESETLMVLDLGAPAHAGLAAGDGIEIRRVVDVAGVGDFVSVTSTVFGRDDEWKAPAYVQSLEDAAIALFVAYRDGRPVSCGRLNLPAGRPFASMWGGSVVPEHRGLGIYRALVTRRSDEARRRGYRYLTTDARESSRPILERVGFVPLSRITGWVLQP
ncbi:MAG TPA: GNAT family N-acetyltransferase, partial [Candidatus Elarobacter sp.]